MEPVSNPSDPGSSVPAPTHVPSGTATHVASGTATHPLRARFLISAARLDQCPDDEVTEVAFVGRSNAGKSSVLNRFGGQRQLARVSRTPGRTQLLNFFSVDEGGRFVDLPGYGYASAPLATRQRWQRELERYLTRRPNLRGMVLVTDIRHPLKDTDLHMIDWARASVLPILVLLNKCDKLRSGARQKAVLEARRELHAAANVDPTAQLSILAFSAEDGTGLPAALGWVRARLADTSGTRELGDDDGDPDDDSYDGPYNDSHDADD